MSEYGVACAMSGKLDVTLTALDFLSDQVAMRPRGLEARSAIKALRQQIEKLVNEAEQESVQQHTVLALLDKLTLAIAQTLQMSSSIELLAPGLTIEMALVDIRFDSAAMQTG
jgi:hypothetical protein